MGRRTTADVSPPHAGLLKGLSLTGGLAMVLVLLAFGAVMIGPYGLTTGQVLSALLGQGDQQAQIVVWNIRLPRVGAALLVGAALAAAGASYQALFRNPLVSPDILGVSAGAGLGAVAGIFLSLPVVMIQASAFVGGMVAVGLVTLVGSLVRGTDRTLTLVLLGVVVGALAGAATSLLKVMADPYDQLPAITFWLLGSLASITTQDIVPALPVVLIGLIPLALLRWRINVLSLGDEEARALGIEAGRTRLIVIASATLITASVTALAGVVGWVGLVIPHIARMLVGPGFGRLLPASAMIGAGYLLVVDTLARTIAAVEVPLGVLTAVIGAPFFVWLLARGRRGWL
ncbi:iron-dicitrate transporter subunit; membrane component of ABC superfamily; KpLE2 phage-like element [Roseovarius sp. EC-HK134]|uniref:FecCD family ABC transporter permease n=1 Tax=unclassified Roseovarius TaxID=2614913 RepID=UPI001256C05A|nr:MULTISPECIES: iron ABC transporter permease [unclassified Roseovarius]VVT05500.1 iron-dicitrate transporter subunit; membrane component of ABC superfamily; KpLE2 phage-like element [Roseovarius sp. EC-SD190]VVT05712.1 iron-dicitrate transporter subunit; membrane component of ABC superfamily; KpLE2 phage-like element [Roseovarius sp. EC-HK134]